jgi:hypothetical protein
MDVMLVLDVLVVDLVRSHSGRLMSRLEQGHELFLESGRVFSDGLVRLWPNKEDLSQMRLRLGVRLLFRRDQ